VRIKSTVVVLEQLNALSVCSQSTSSPNLSLVLIHIQRLRRVLLLEDGDCEGARELKTKLSEQIEMRFCDDCCNPNSLLLRSARLDPRTADLVRVGIAPAVVQKVETSIIKDLLERRKAAGQTVNIETLRVIQSHYAVLVSHLEKESERFLGEFEFVPRPAGTEDIPADLYEFADFFGGGHDSEPEEVQPRQFADLDPIDRYHTSQLDFVQAFSPVAMILLSTPGGTGGVEGLGSAVSRVQGDYASNQKDATLEQLLSIKNYVDTPSLTWMPSSCVSARSWQKRRRRRGRRRAQRNPSARSNK
jgi:hypothetical protein